LFESFTPAAAITFRGESGRHMDETSGESFMIRQANVASDSYTPRLAVRPISPAEGPVMASYTQYRPVKSYFLPQEMG
jgi:hypothetical protein